MSFFFFALGDWRWQEMFEYRRTGWTADKRQESGQINIQWPWRPATTSATKERKDSYMRYGYRRTRSYTIARRSRL